MRRMFGDCEKKLDDAACEAYTFLLNAMLRGRVRREFWTLRQLASPSVGSQDAVQWQACG